MEHSISSPSASHLFLEIVFSLFQKSRSSNNEKLNVLSITKMLSKQANLNLFQKVK